MLSGIIFIFFNLCYVECAGYDLDIYYQCDDECVCLEYFDLVCVENFDGDIFMFDNLCFVECVGYGLDQYF